MDTFTRRIKQSVLARWRSKPKNHPAYEDEEHSLQGKTGKVRPNHLISLPSSPINRTKKLTWANFHLDSRYLLRNIKRSSPNDGVRNVHSHAFNIAINELWWGFWK